MCSNGAPQALLHLMRLHLLLIVLIVLHLLLSPAVAWRSQAIVLSPGVERHLIFQLQAALLLLKTTCRASDRILMLDKQLLRLLAMMLLLV